MGQPNAEQEPFLLPDYQKELGHEWEEEERNRRPSRRWTLTSMFLICSVLGNLVLLLPWLGFRLTTLPSTEISPEDRPDNVRDVSSSYKSPYSGLGYDTEVVYSHHTDFTSDNKTLSAEAWNNLEDILMIAVDDDWIKKHDLPPSLGFPWDLDKNLYFVKLGHQLHCLKSIRWAFDYILEHGADATKDLALGHIDHCLDTLRQDVMCHADDTPMATLKYINGAGEGQVMQCKNFDKLLEWINAPDRQSCHKHIKPWLGVKHSIERFANCPEDSPYYPVMQEYFRVHGHLD